MKKLIKITFITLLTLCFSLIITIAIVVNDTNLTIHSGCMGGYKPLKGK